MYDNLITQLEQGVILYDVSDDGTETTSVRSPTSLERRAANAIRLLNSRLLNYEQYTRSLQAQFALLQEEFEKIKNAKVPEKFD